MTRPWVFILFCGLGLASWPQPPPTPVTLRMASIAPEGTAWARMLGDFADEVDRSTQGRVRIKWALGGSAGSEVTTLDKVRNGELAGLAGAISCQQVAPSLKAVEVVGMTQTDAEA